MIRFLCCFILSIFLLVAVITAPAMADCANPSGVAGALTYNTTHNVMQYCEGSDWIKIGD